MIGILVTGCLATLGQQVTAFPPRLRSPEDSAGTTSASKGQKDLLDVWYSLVNYKTAAAKEAKADSSKYHYSVVPGIGYTLSTGWAGVIAGNVGFFTNGPERSNESNINAIVVYSQYEQLTIALQSNIFTRDNKFNILTDWRYYKYPQVTYGLGGHSSLSDEEEMDYSHFRIHQVILRKIFPNVYAGAGYFWDYHWNITQSELPGGGESDASRYGLTSTSTSSGPVANIQYDSRKNAINPKGGSYANVLYRPNFKFFGSDSNWQGMIIDLRKYIPFPAGSRNVLAIWNYNWLTIAGKPPYLDLPSTGWDNYNNTGRGYIQGRFRSANMLYLETEYRFTLTRNGMFGGVVFANAQSFSNYPNSSFDNVWPGLGVGLRVKVNKRSDTNVAIDYGFGMEGSRGFFVNLGEVF